MICSRDRASAGQLLVRHVLMRKVLAQTLQAFARHGRVRTVDLPVRQPQHLAADGARQPGPWRPASAGVSLVAGTAVVVTTFSAGGVLSAAGLAIAYISDGLAKALLYKERVTR